MRYKNIISALKDGLTVHYKNDRSKVFISGDYVVVIDGLLTVKIPLYKNSLKPFSARDFFIKEELYELSEKKDSWKKSVFYPHLKKVKLYNDKFEFKGYGQY